MAVPLGGPKEGRQRYMTGLGLMHEDIMGLIQPGQGVGGTLKNMLSEIMGRFNPILKYPIEVGTGKQLYSGRELVDLDTAIGRIVSNITGEKIPLDVPPELDQILMNSPLARMISSMRTATDTRKSLTARAMNLLTGVRIADIDKEKHTRIAVREAMEERLRGRGPVRALRPHLYVRKEDLAQMDPLDRALYELYAQYGREARRAAAARRRQQTLLP
jgi:hypothetical protein